MIGPGAAPRGLAVVLVLVLGEALAAEPGAEAGAVEALAYAGAFLVLGVALLVAEFFLVSFGLLGAGALAAALVAVHFAFGAGPIAGWLFVLVSAVATVVIMRWGIRRIRRSRVVPKAEITADAGYRHRAEAVGVSVGAIGRMTTAAYPTGRARFSEGECDVQAQQGTLEAGTRVVVRRVDGPIVFVAAEAEARGGAGC